MGRPNTRPTSLGLAILIFLALTGCAEQPQTEAATRAVPPTVTAAETLETTAAASATPLPQPEGASPPPPPTAEAPTPQPTAWPRPTIPKPAIAALPPAAASQLQQAAYAESDCSDKYPCNEDSAGWEGRLRVPAGFSARYFARIDGLPTVMTTGPDGLLYVATISGEIYTVDRAGQVTLFLSGLVVPTGIVFQPESGRLYLTSRLVNEEIGEAMVAYVEDDEVVPLLTGLPCCYTSFHAASGLSFGPDGYLYVGIGARADHGEILDTDIQDELSPIEASILRVAPDGSEYAPYAHGLRNSYDHAWDSQGRLYSGDNGPDAQPGWDAQDEFHLIMPGGQHGYPWYECQRCFAPPAGVEVIPPTYGFPPHSSPTGVAVYLADQWPGYFDSIFVALWSAFPGAQKVVRFAPGGVDAGDFLTGLSSPIDITIGPDGQMYVVDYFTGIIVQISYDGE